MSPELASVLLALAPACPDRCATADNHLDVRVGGAVVHAERRGWGPVVEETSDTVTILAESNRIPLSEGQRPPLGRPDVGAPNLAVRAVVPRPALDERLAVPTRVSGSGEHGVWVSGETSQVSPRPVGDGTQVRWNDWGFSGVGALPDAVWAGVYTPLPPPERGEVVWLGDWTPVVDAAGGHLADYRSDLPFPARLVARGAERTEIEVHTGGTRIRGFVPTGKLVPAPEAGAPPARDAGPVPLVDTFFEALAWGCAPGAPCVPRPSPFGPGGEPVAWQEGPWVGFAPRPSGRTPRGGEEVVVVGAPVYDAPDGALLASSVAQWPTPARRTKQEDGWSRVVVERGDVALRGWVPDALVLPGLPGISAPVAWVSAGAALTGDDGAAVGEVLRDTPGQVLACEGDRARLWFNTAWGDLGLWVPSDRLDRRCPRVEEP